MKRLNLRNNFALTLLFALILPILAACGGGTTAPAAPTAASAATAAPAAGAATAAPAEAATAAPADAPTAMADAPTAMAASADGKVLHIHINQYPDIFDPQKSSFSNEIGILQLNYEGLVRLDKEQKPVPAAAESWKFNDAGNQISFTLRDGLKYSDGSPLTSQNFRYAIERTCDPKTAGQYQSILFEIVGCGDWASTLVTDTAAYDKGKAGLGIETPDDKTLTLKLTNPAPYYPYLAYMWVMYPAKQELVETGEDWWKDPKNHVGNGPFKITTIEEEQLIRFEANENYWGGRPKLDAIEFIYQKDSAVALEAYRAGQLDIMDPDPSQLPAIKSDAELSKELLEFPGAQTSQLQFNLAKEPFEDVNVRKAFAYAFDRNTFCEQIRNGDCLPTLVWIPPGVPGSIETTDYGFDPAKAKEALAASKYKDAAGLPEITFTYSSDDPAAQPRVEWIAGQFRDVLGVSVKLEPLEGKAIVALKKEPATYPMMSTGGWIQDYPDPQNWLSVYWLSSATFAKRVSYKNDEFDKLVKQGDVELDPAKRIQFYEQAHQVLIDTQAGVNLFHPAEQYLVKPFVTGISTTSSDSEWPGQWQPQDIDIQK